MRYPSRPLVLGGDGLTITTNAAESWRFKMKVSLSRDARPQAMTLLVAATISILLWFIPYAEILAYPFRIFVTFIHEGGHAIAALITGNSVSSLSVATNSSGETYTTQGGLISQLLISSAGYIGSMATDKNQRRRGIGSRIADTLIHALHQRGVTEIELQATDDGEGIYRSLGFTTPENRIPLTKSSDADQPLD